ncbi:LacI family DNA-binding transcriptional regulator [Amycolatopsis sp. NPDC005003]
MTVTIRGVARLADGSASSVCRALATPDKVRVATRDRVHQAAAQLATHAAAVPRTTDQDIGRSKYAGNQASRPST